VVKQRVIGAAMTRNSPLLWIVRLCLVLGAAAAFGGMAEQIRIQQESIAQPKVASGPYTHPLTAHGFTHFITDHQLSHLRLASEGLYYGVALLIILGIAHQIMMVRTTPVRRNILMPDLDKRLGLE
jgi:hypothetical protein